MTSLSNNQKTFCHEYVNNGKNGTQAYLKAYKTCKKEQTARTNASRLLTNANIIDYIEELQGELKNEAIMDAKERMEWLTKVVKGDVKHISYDGSEYEPYISDKMKAIDILNKMDGQYSQNVKLSGNVSHIQEQKNAIDDIVAQMKPVTEDDV